MRSQCGNFTMCDGVRALRGDAFWRAVSRRQRRNLPYVLRVLEIPDRDIQPGDVVGGQRAPRSCRIFP